VSFDVRQEYGANQSAPTQPTHRAESDPMSGLDQASVSSSAIVLALTLLVAAVVVMFYVLPAWFDPGAVSVNIRP
jgi:hypothetical protein